MSASTEEIVAYLSLLSDPDQDRITGESWRVVDDADEVFWMGWRPDCVVTVEHPPPASYYDQRSDITLDALFRVATSSVRSGLDATSGSPWTPPPGSDDPALHRMAGLDELHREELLGRAGWLWLSGSILRSGRRIACCFPLLERHIRLRRVGESILPQWVGSLLPHPLVSRLGDNRFNDFVDRFISIGAGADGDRDIAHAIGELLARVGVTLDHVADSTMHPVSIDPNAGTTLVPGAGFYLAKRRSEIERPRSALSNWSGKPLAASALAEIYRTIDATETGGPGRPRPIRSALPLNGRQREAIERLGAERSVTVSGPPGTGKTHMVVAAACDAVARGQTVLIATKSDFAAESACELLGQYPTPPYLRFGSEAHRREVAERLSGGTPAGPTDQELGEFTVAADHAWERLESLGARALSALERKQAFEQARLDPNLAFARGAPKIIDDPHFDEAELDAALLQESAASGLGRHWAIRRLRRLVGASSDLDGDALRRAIAGARAQRAMELAMSAETGTQLDELWERLDVAEREAKRAQALLDVARRARPRRPAMASTAALATTLRSSDPGLLAIGSNVQNTAFLEQLPFWIGTLDEIEATLPAVPGMFDLVILDEASQIDQIAAAPALCRAKQAMIVGDPRQLRHHIALSAEQVSAARHHAGIAPGTTARVVDVVENSLFDVAAAASPITWLDEHFRSLPHLIQFSSDRFYQGQLRLMTQHPRHDGHDAIKLRRVPHVRRSRVNEAEVAAVIAEIERLAREPALAESIGVVTPFSEQADALESAIVDRFDYRAIRDLRLRVGTVHGVQGTERDTILLSLVIDERDFDTSLAVIEDPHLFNVMTTRARTRMEIFHSFEPDRLPPGLLADYFRYEANPPRLRHRDAGPSSGWTRRLGDALRLGRVDVATGYPVAGHRLDLVVGTGDAAFGVETTVHPDGAEAHAERHLTLRRAGWHLVTVFESDWMAQPEEAAVHLAAIAARRAQALDRPT